jgi:hypothetical protein
MEKFYEAAARDAESRSREDQLSTILGSTSVPHYEEPVNGDTPNELPSGLQICMPNIDQIHRIHANQSISREGTKNRDPPRSPDFALMLGLW